jgi:ATP-dependent metalloprotease FtsH
VEILRNNRSPSHIEVRPPKGILLEGEAGTGKTLMAKAIAGEAGVAFYEMSGAEFIQAIVGVGASRIRDIFRRARVNKPCIIFIDEIDAIGVRRSESGFRSNEERDQTLNQLLTEMDGFSPTENVILIAATNRADLLDPALLRAGRFDRKIKVNKPDVLGRQAILEVHSRKYRVSKDINLAQIARDTAGLSPADLSNLFNEACLEVFRANYCCDHDRRKSELITTNDLYTALNRIQFGVRRKLAESDTMLSNLIASCEAGKALVAMIISNRYGRIEKLLKITAISNEGSNANFSRFEDYHYYLQSIETYQDRLRVLLAGRAAEEVLYGSHSTTSRQNIASGLRIARQIVYHFAFCDIGMPSYAPVIESRTFKNNWINKVTDNMDYDPIVKFSLPGDLEPTSKTRHMMESVVFSLVFESYIDAFNILETYKPTLKYLSILLKNHDEMFSDQLDKIILQNPAVLNWIQNKQQTLSLFKRKC